jgi:ATP-dependent Clp protease ATP-binding subunit ClpA
MGDDLDGDKSDKTPKRLLRDLRAEVARAQRRGGLRPCIGREQELAQVIQILTRPYSPAVTPTITPHVVIRGPDGVGCHALAYALATRLTISPDEGEFARIRAWAIAAVRVNRDSQRIDEWLRAEVQSRGNVTILVIENLPDLLRFSGLAETLAHAARHPNIRIVAVADDRDYRAVRNEHAELARLFNTVDLAPPRPELAVEMMRAHGPRLERRYDVSIAADVAAEAVRLAPQYSRQALPGAAIALVEQACATATHRAVAAVAELDWLDQLGAHLEDDDADDAATEYADAALAARATIPTFTPALITAQSLRSIIQPDASDTARSSAR